MNRENPFVALLQAASQGDPVEKLKQSLEFPRFIDVELTNECSRRCGFCPQANGLMTRPHGYMTYGMFMKISAEVIPNKTPVRFIRFGEPTMHPQWNTCVRFLAEAGVLTHMNSNGYDLDPDKVLDSGLDSLKISIHGQGSWNAAKRVIEARGSATYPFITIAYLTTEQQYGPLDADMVTVTSTKDLTCDRTAYCSPCPEVYDKLSVDWDGKVTACCGDYNRMMALGDLTDCGVTLRSIWRFSSALQKYRNLLAHGRHKELPLCRACVRSDGGDL